MMETMNVTELTAPKGATSRVSPRCSGTLTHAIAEGPYYKPGSPEKDMLYEEGVPGERLTVTGCVFDAGCRPAAHAWLDFWQANGQGRYDNAGYTLRGHQYTDASGRFILETVVPGRYGWRTPHIHVKLRLNDNSSVLTTQLFFPELPSNQGDFLFDETQVVELEKTPGGKLARFSFVLDTG
ncbi:MAG: intradiol ring-cleavage dioxygenase [Chloroflexi bacterium]|nr:intradiol ring-cleavage dioxygenase [Chloroflexota bacterium]